MLQLDSNIQAKLGMIVLMIAGSKGCRGGQGHGRISTALMTGDSITLEMGECLMVLWMWPRWLQPQRAVTQGGEVHQTLLTRHDQTGTQPDLFCGRQLVEVWKNSAAHQRAQSPFGHAIALSNSMQPQCHSRGLQILPLLVTMQR